MAAGQQIVSFALRASAPSEVVLAILNSLTDELSEVYWGEPIPHRRDRSVCRIV